ncbi:MAG TPA: aminotransferase class I/II-fold pyridoxal phosphate-dependent enzyme [bacterium]|nr:aminotransferase class I/II-fold pyridoxal phosphate-dependent enzyme [bacterium]HPP29930.1 aminotransferase class I/II-fold pyridoxal phosphate-dependent enzyme [bacterium]
MAIEKLKYSLEKILSQLKQTGTLKGKEDVIVGIKPASGKKGPRYILAGDSKEYIRMNSNSYLGLSLNKEVIKASEKIAAKFGAGPGSVRFINGTFSIHTELEKKLAFFHKKQSAIIFSSAYAAVCGVISPLISEDTVVLSDTLNHNSIINAIKLSKPKEKKIYPHLDINSLERQIKELKGKCRRVLIISDGIFSMRGDYPDLRKIVCIAKRYSPYFEEGVITIIDDSHGIGAYGKTGRGTSEITGEWGIDIIIATLGKALGVNGGYAVSDKKIIEYLRETSPFYIYSNPITPGEAGAALKSLEILDSKEGIKLLSYLRYISNYFKKNLISAGYEIINGIHPIVPLMVRDTEKTVKLVEYLKKKGILVTGLKYPVVPRGDECIRFQVNCTHTKYDIDFVLETLREYRKKYY